MSGDEAEARRFIQAHITSVAQLELLLLLRTNPGQTWSADDLARELRTDAAWTRAQLEELRAAGLCAAGENASYRFAPASAALEQSVSAVAKAYLLHRVSMIEAIYSKPSSSIRVFADAFRLKKEPPDG